MRGAKLKIAVLGLASLLAQSTVADDQPQFNTISMDRDASAYKKFPVVELSLGNNKATINYLESVPSADEKTYDKTVFHEQKAKSGSKFKIRGFLIAENLVNANLSKGKGVGGPFYKGDDFPDIQQILQELKTTDTKAFMKTMAKLAEYRRSAQTDGELKTVAEKLLNKKDVSPAAAHAFKDQIFFGTGLVEVEEDASAKDANIRKFIPMQAVLDGKASIDLKTAQVEILKSTLMYLVEGDLKYIPESEQAGAAKVASVRADLEKLTNCAASNCVIDSTKFTDLLSSMLTIGAQDNTAKLDVMDDDYDKKITEMQLQKIQKLRAEFLKACPQ